MFRPCLEKPFGTISQSYKFFYILGRCKITRPKCWLFLNSNLINSVVSYFWLMMSNKEGTLKADPHSFICEQKGGAVEIDLLICLLAKNIYSQNSFPQYTTIVLSWNVPIFFIKAFFNCLGHNCKFVFIELAPVWLGLQNHLKFKFLCHNFSWLCILLRKTYLCILLVEKNTTV